MLMRSNNTKSLEVTGYELLILIVKDVPEFFFLDLGQPLRGRAVQGCARCAADSHAAMRRVSRGRARYFVPAFGCPYHRSAQKRQFNKMYTNAQKAILLQNAAHF